MTTKEQTNYWTVPIEDLTRQVGEYTGMEWASPKHAQRQLLSQVLIARAFDAASEKQNQLVKATWVLAGATILLAVATIIMGIGALA